MKKGTITVLAGLSLAALACKDSTGVTDLNNVSADALAGGLTRSSVQLLATGLLSATRADLSSRYVVFSETLARDFYRLDPNEPRFITETLGGLSDGSGFVGGGAFTNYYATVRSANTIINGLPAAAGVTTAEKSATSGFARTFKALALYRVLETRDSLGIAVDVNHPIDDPPAPFVCKPNALAYISAQLDSAKADLAAGGAAFPFVLPASFSFNGDFTTPAALSKFASALKGKVELYRALDHQKPNAASAATAITELNASYLNAGATTPAQLAASPYNGYSTSAGEAVNPLSDALIYLNPSVKDSIQAGDTRAAKILPTTSNTRNGVTSAIKPLGSSPTGALVAPIAILKNSELLLLRAQAKIETGDLVGATADINVVRTVDGGLPPIAVPATKAAAISAVLYEKRYSLLGEGAQRFVDLRAYRYLNASFRQKELPTDPFQSALAIPINEQNARGGGTITPVCP
jgi:hypothetical protein